MRSPQPYPPEAAAERSAGPTVQRSSEYDPLPGGRGWHRPGNGAWYDGCYEDMAFSTDVEPPAVAGGFDAARDRRLRRHVRERPKNGRLVAVKAKLTLHGTPLTDANARGRVTRSPNDHDVRGSGSSAAPVGAARRIGLLLVAAATAAAVSAAAAHAVVPGGNGLIAFTSSAAGNADVAVLDPCGAAHTVIGGPAADLKPVWSPDGRRLAFMSNRDGNFDIYSANADGSDLRRLTDDPANDFNPAWSPDGRELAWNSDRSGDFEIYVMDADGSDVRQLTRASGIDSVPSWSPRGNRIAFESSRDGDAEVYVMNADGSEQHDVSNDHFANDRNPAWSPNGRKIAFTSDRAGSSDIWVANADGSVPIDLTPGRATERNAAWSPDGTEVAFASDRGGSFQLYAARADGSDVTRLTHDAASDTIPDWQRFPGHGSPPPTCRHPVLR